MFVPPTVLQTTSERYKVPCGVDIIFQIKNVIDNNYPVGSKKLAYIWTCDKQEDVCEEFISYGKASF